MKILILLSLVLAQLAFADHRGGNGGHPFEIALRGRLLKVARFVMENPRDFGKLSETNWYLIAQETGIEITTSVLRDKFGVEKCATNFPKKSLIVFNHACFLTHQQDQRTLNSLLAHELFNLRGIELPNRGSSVYPYSSKFLEIDRVLSVETTGLSFLSSKCTLSSEASTSLSRVSTGIVQLKGFRAVSTDAKAEFHLNLSDPSCNCATLKRRVWGVTGLIKEELAWKRSNGQDDDNLIELPLCVLL